MRLNGLAAPTDELPASPLTVDFGRYVGLSPHAEGGLGEVFTATDTELHRVVALKRLQDRCADDASSRRRFLLEAEVTARLEHPGVVPVHSLFRDDADRPCYSMRFIQGKTLADALREYHAAPPDPVAFRRLLQSFIQVCKTIAYAHSRGVIHRDLKPQNIMLGRFGETIVVDWGLAKVVGRHDGDQPSDHETTLRPSGSDSGDRTEMGSAVGTPAYMSPEQAAGRWDVINAVSDVYGLGAVLYTLLSGQAPLEKGNWPEMQQRIQRGDFPRPRSVKPTTPKALEAICLKAMAMRPEDRYPSAEKLAADVEQWLADEPVKAYREPFTTRAWRWARRRKGWVAGAAAALVIAVLGRMYVLERDKFIKERRKIVDENFPATKYAYYHFMQQQEGMDREVRATLDRFASQIGHDARLASPALEPLQRDLLQKALEFWERAVAIDAGTDREPSAHANYYQTQKALCLARLGEHERAFDLARQLWSSPGITAPPEGAEYDRARVYALCATAVKDNGELARLYGDGAMTCLQKEYSNGYFRRPAPANRLMTDPDLVSLRSREDFDKFLRDAVKIP